MPTFNELRFPSNSSYPDYSSPYATEIEGSISSGLKNETILVKGGGFNNDSFAALVTSETELSEVIALENIYRNPTQVEIKFSELEAGSYQLYLATGEAISEPISLDVTPEITEDSKPEDLQKQGIISFADLSKLTIGSGSDDNRDVDVLYYRTVAPKQSNDGITTTSKGYLAFPRLAWDTTKETKTFSIIYYASNETRYYVPGLAGESYNWISNDFNKLDIAVRIRAHRGIYGQYGLAEDNRNSYREYSLQYGSYNNYFRCDITNNGKAPGFARIYQLPDDEPSNWLKGRLVHEEPIAKIPARKSAIVTPGVWDYFGSRSRLVGVVVK